MYSLRAVEARDQNPFHGTEIKVSWGLHSRSNTRGGPLHLQLLGAPSHPTLFSLARCSVSSLCPSHKLHGMGFSILPDPQNFLSISRALN